MTGSKQNSIESNASFINEVASFNTQSWLSVTPKDSKMTQSLRDSVIEVNESKSKILSPPQTKSTSHSKIGGVKKKHNEIENRFFSPRDKVNVLSVNLKEFSTKVKKAKQQAK